METPPRMWGIQDKISYKQYKERNTPTHVGNTFQASHSLSHRQKHPHACGEYTCQFHLKYINLETPPRMWGIHVISLIEASDARNTPTHVGNTKPLKGEGVLFKKHPHACGEYDHVLLSYLVHLETPPRMWGIRNTIAKMIWYKGNTPTHVGNTEHYS